MWLTFESGGLVLLVCIDLVVVSLEMVFVIRDAVHIAQCQFDGGDCGSEG